MGPGGRAPSVAVACAVLSVAILVHWSFRVFNTGKDRVTRYSVDTYYEAVPTSEYSFGRMADGDLPLWNPHQLCGMPSLAVPYVGHFYPGNAPFLFFDVDIGIEVIFLLHQLFAALSMWLLLRSFGVGAMGAYAGAITFIWSSWFAFALQWPSRHSGLSWAPATLLAIEWTIRGRRRGAFCLVAAVACQMLNGSPEVFVHTMYASAIFSFFRLLQRARVDSWRSVGGTACLLIAGVGAGVALSAIQLVPTLELIGESVRSEGAPHQSKIMGMIPRWRFVRDILDVHARINVGTLPLLLPAIGYGLARFRVLWLFALVVGVAAAELVFGATFYDWYRLTPFGEMFRRAFKFMTLFELASAVAAGVVLGRLQSFRELPRGSLVVRPEWLGAVLLAAALLFFAPGRSLSSHWPLGVMLGLFVAFALVGSRLRTLVLAAVLGLQAVVLFNGYQNQDLRPYWQKGRLDLFRPALSEFADVDKGRVLLYPHLGFRSEVSAKQATRMGFYSVSDYQPLALARHERFSGAGSGRMGRSKEGYWGAPELAETTRYDVLDLAGTRWYVTNLRSKGKAILEKAVDSGELSRHGTVPGLPRRPGLAIYERASPLPRAYFVDRGRFLSSAEKVLDQIKHGPFAARSEVLLEEADRGAVPTDFGGIAVAPMRPGLEESEQPKLAKIVEYEPERVTINVRADSPGFVVLTDSYYPGWRATANNDVAPILRANYLFRAVPVEAGETTVTFEYRPDSFRQGALVSACTLLLVIVAAVATVRRGRPLLG